MKKKKYIIGIGYPLYSNSFKLEYNPSLKTILPIMKTSHGLETIKLFTHPFSGDKREPIPESIMLNPKATFNGK